MRIPFVLVRLSVCRQLDKEAASCGGKPERGGILLGCYRGGDLEITGHTIPGPTDQSQLFSFVRVDPIHQVAATAAWSSTCGTHTWVGEWHTHPSGEISPSGTDLSNWSKLSRKAGLPMAFALAVPGEWGVFVVRPYWMSKSAMRLAFVETGTTGLVFGPPNTRERNRHPRF